MAIRVQQIDPLDLRDSLGIGINLPLSGTAVFNTTYTSKDATKANLINYFLTNKGERYLNPNFGSDIRSFLFDNISEDRLIAVKARITKELKVYFPRVNPLEFRITADPDRNTLIIYVHYEIVNSNIQDEILINIEQ